MVLDDPTLPEVAAVSRSGPLPGAVPVEAEAYRPTECAVLE